MKRMVLIWVDGTDEGAVFRKWTMDTYRWVLETIKRSDNTKGFVLLPKRWVVERTKAVVKLVPSLVERL
jgi:putative transposase